MHAPPFVLIMFILSAILVDFKNNLTSHKFKKANGKLKIIQNPEKISNVI